MLYALDASVVAALGGKETIVSLWWEKEVYIPLSEMMIHIKNAVKVIASGKIRRSTIQSGAF